MFVELNRTFHELADDASAPAADDRILVASGARLMWADLLQLHRVVLLSEAGSGKTEEIQHTARHLRLAGKSAFFLRLEHVVRDFETAFEEGSHDEFESWLRSTDEGWLLLDSIDESRLRDPSDFEAAIRRLGVKLKAAAHRTHIVLTGRTAAWRPLSDLQLCESQFPFAPSIRSADASEETGDTDARIRTTTRSPGAPKIFTVVALDDLSVEQVQVFARHRGVVDVRSLLDEVERADGWSFTSRPLDLEELLDFWKRNKRIGGRLELMRSSIERRLAERDQTRDEVGGVTPERVRQGVRRLAAGCTLTHRQTISVPDGTKNSRGLRASAVLSEWDAADCLTLLQRPVFDEQIYGTVRFHHRSVREYLTAEWFAALLTKETSRRAIEQLFFREQYGLEVVPPAMQPILPWLAILDGRIQERARRVAPEVLIAGGDPSQLALETRQSILQDVCAKLAGGAPSRSGHDLGSIQRFASAELTEDVIRHLASHTDEESQAFLLRMVWQGRLAGALPAAMAMALSAEARQYPRRVAFRAVRAVGSDDDVLRVRTTFLEESPALDREWLAELLDGLRGTAETIDWLFKCVRKVKDVQQHHVDHLSSRVGELVMEVDAGLLPMLVDEFAALLNEPPVIERRHCEISRRHRWLLKPAALAIHRLLGARDPASLSLPTLAILHKVPLAREYDTFDLGEEKQALGGLVQAWPELNFQLFWYTVEHERQWLDKKNAERLTDCWRASIRPTCTAFGPADFERAIDAIATRLSLDDKLVAVSLAFRLYAGRGRQIADRRLLKAATKTTEELRDQLSKYLRPPKQSAEAGRFRKSDGEWKRRAKRQQRQEQRNRQDWRDHLAQNVDAIRDPGLEQANAVSKSQHYLYHQLRATKQNSSRWSDGNWRSVQGEFGVDVARAFRDGCVAFWRRHRPTLVSEGAPLNSTPFGDIFGLTGLAIESNEVDGWARSLRQDEVQLSFRYAMHELNGFPPWFPAVFERHPVVIRDLALVEVAYELQAASAEQGSQYLCMTSIGQGSGCGISSHLTC
jgi:hypothetical protein